MKRGLIVLGLTALILTLAIVEIVYINDTIKDMNRECSSIYYYVTSDNFSFDTLLDKTDTLEDYWQDREKKLCLIVSHKDMANIADNISYVKASAINQNKEDAITYSLLLKENMSYLSHLISFNIENVF